MSVKKRKHSKKERNIIRDKITSLISNLGFEDAGDSYFLYLRSAVHPKAMAATILFDKFPNQQNILGEIIFGIDLLFEERSDWPEGGRSTLKLALDVVVIILQRIPDEHISLLPIWKILTDMSKIIGDLDAGNVHPILRPVSKNSTPFGPRGYSRDQKEFIFWATVAVEGLIMKGFGVGDAESEVAKRAFDAAVVLGIITKPEEGLSSRRIRGWRARSKPHSKGYFSFDVGMRKLADAELQNMAEANKIDEYVEFLFRYRLSKEEAEKKCTPTA